jgi:phosphatidylserine/phosphatidylglycerophosphate/cardiolipin synthase-like enzyme
VLLDKKPRSGEAIPTTDEDVRRAWGEYLHRVTLDQWAQEHLTDFNKWVKFVHTKIILIDPLTPTPTIITGSANYSDNSTTNNEENSVIIRGDGTDIAQRIADIYLTEYQRIFMHFVFRSWANRNSPTVNTGGGVGRLTEDDSWIDPYYQPGSWRERQRRTFAGT